MFGKSIGQKGYTPHNSNINKINPISNGHPVYSNTERTERPNMGDRYSSTVEETNDFGTGLNSHRKSTSNIGFGIGNHQMAQQQPSPIVSNRRTIRRTSDVSV
jgi:hypothetical protein